MKIMICPPILLHEIIDASANGLGTPSSILSVASSNATRAGEYPRVAEHINYRIIIVTLSSGSADHFV